jgi:hypothetical protein
VEAMKKSILLISVFLVSFLLTGTLYAKYSKGYTVVSKDEKSVVIEDQKGEKTTVETDKAAKFNEGTKVEYDKEKNKLKKDEKPDGC